MAKKISTSENGSIKTEWDLSFLYDSPSDPKIDKDIKNADALFSDFERKYRNNKRLTVDVSTLLRALQDSEKLAGSEAGNPYVYLSYLQSLDSKNADVIAKINLVSQEFSRISNKTVFFDVVMSKIDKKYQNKFLKSPELKKYKYLLKKIFESSKYVLSEPEEKILSLKSLTSRDLWTDLTERLENKITIEHKGEEIPISKALSLIPELKNQEDRLSLHRKCMSALEKISEIAEAELNAIVTDKKINDELRGYKEAYDATIMGYQNDKSSVLNLVKVITQSFNLSQRFYKVKAKMLGVDKLFYSDRSADVGRNDKKITFEESFRTLREVFHKIDPKFSEILENMAKNGQIDVYPKVGKRGGAFCSSHVNLPTMVLLNHTDSFKSLITFAHEMGHAIHSEFSKIQPVIYQSYSMSTAEVASTLFESFVFYDAVEKMSKEEKVVALHDKIQDDISTIFRQIACFNFELDMHNSIREKGNLSAAELRTMMNKHMKNYLGDIFDIKLEDGNFFVTWPHLRYTFYVYSYAFGQLASKALYKKYSEDKSYVENIKKFLSLGGSMSPEDIFKSIGVDVKKPDFWQKGIQSIEDDIILLESLVNKK